MIQSGLFSKKEKLFCLRRATAFAVAFCMIASDQAVFAAASTQLTPENLPGLIRGSAPEKESFLPENWGRLEAVHRGTSNKTILFIQDAHDSLEAQENISKIIQNWVRTYGIRTVFEEGFQGTVPTSNYFDWIRQPGMKEKVASFLLDRLRLGGAEYAHITRKDEFDLVGIDDARLHEENLKWYQKTTVSAPLIRKDLKALKKRLDQLAARRFDRHEKAWIKVCERYHAGILNFHDFITQTAAWIGKDSLPAVRFPQIHLVLHWVSSAEETDRERSVIQGLDVSALFRELEDFETFAAETLFENPVKLDIFRYRRELLLLEKLHRFELTPEAFLAAKSSLKALNTRAIGEFLHRETRKPLVLSKAWETSIQDAVRFYETAESRDAALGKRLEAFFAAQDRQSAILVFGGFHKHAVTALLRKLNYSYAVVSPKIHDVSKKHQAYYRELMQAGYPEQLPDTASAALATIPPRLFSVVPRPNFPNFLRRTLPSDYLRDLAPDFAAAEDHAVAESHRSEMRNAKSYKLGMVWRREGQGYALTLSESEGGRQVWESYVMVQTQFVVSSAEEVIGNRKITGYETGGYYPVILILEDGGRIALGETGVVIVNEGDQGRRVRQDVHDSDPARFAFYRVGALRSEMRIDASYDTVSPVVEELNRLAEKPTELMKKLESVLVRHLDGGKDAFHILKGMLAPWKAYLPLREDERTNPRLWFPNAQRLYLSARQIYVMTAVILDKLLKGEINPGRELIVSLNEVKKMQSAVLAHPKALHSWLELDDPFEPGPSTYHYITLDQVIVSAVMLAGNAAEFKAILRYLKGIADAEGNLDFAVRILKLALEQSSTKRERISEWLPALSQFTLLSKSAVLLGGVDGQYLARFIAEVNEVLESSGTVRILPPSSPDGSPYDPSSWASVARSDLRTLDAETAQSYLRFLDQVEAEKSFRETNRQFFDRLSRSFDLSRMLWQQRDLAARLAQAASPVDANRVLEPSFSGYLVDIAGDIWLLTQPGEKGHRFRIVRAERKIRREVEIDDGEDLLGGLIGGLVTGNVLGAAAGYVIGGEMRDTEVVRSTREFTDLDWITTDHLNRTLSRGHFTGMVSREDLVKWAPARSELRSEWHDMAAQLEEIAASGGLLASDARRVAGEVGKAAAGESVLPKATADEARELIARFGSAPFRIAAIAISQLNQPGAKLRDEDRELLAFLPPAGLYAIAVKIGGTSIAAKIIDSEGRFYGTQVNMPTFAHKGREETYQTFVARIAEETSITVEEAEHFLRAEVLNRIRTAIKSAFHSAKIKPELVAWIGISSPGPFKAPLSLTEPLDERGEFQAKANNIPFNQGLVLSEEIEKRVEEELDHRFPVRVLHDGIAGAFGERSRLGTVPDARNMLYVIWGSGIGGALIVDGKLFSGGEAVNGLLGEFPNHMVYFSETGRFEYMGPQVRGQFHHLAEKDFSSAPDSEDVLKGTALAERFKIAPEKMTPEQSRWAGIQMGQALGAFLKSLRAQYGPGFLPETIVIGSGIAHRGEPLRAGIEEGFKRELVRPQEEELGFIHGRELKHGDLSTQAMDAEVRARLEKEWGTFYLNQYIAGQNSSARSELRSNPFDLSTAAGVGPFALRSELRVLETDQVRAVRKLLQDEANADIEGVLVATYQTDLIPRDIMPPGVMDNPMMPFVIRSNADNFLTIPNEDLEFHQRLSELPFLSGGLQQIVLSSGMDTAKHQSLDMSLSLHLLPVSDQKGVKVYGANSYFPFLPKWTVVTRSPEKDREMTQLIESRMDYLQGAGTRKKLAERAEFYGQILKAVANSGKRQIELTQLFSSRYGITLSVRHKRAIRSLEEYGIHVPPEFLNAKDVVVREMSQGPGLKLTRLLDFIREAFGDLREMQRKVMIKELLRAVIQSSRKEKVTFPFSPVVGPRDITEVAGFLISAPADTLGQIAMAMKPDGLLSDYAPDDVMALIYRVLEPVVRRRGSEAIGMEDTIASRGYWVLREAQKLSLSPAVRQKLDAFIEKYDELSSRSELRSMPDALSTVRNGVKKLRSELRVSVMSQTGGIESLTYINYEQPETGYSGDGEGVPLYAILSDKLLNDPNLGTRDEIVAVMFNPDIESLTDDNGIIVVNPEKLHHVFIMAVPPTVKGLLGTVIQNKTQSAREEMLRKFWEAAIQTRAAEHYYVHWGQVKVPRKVSPGAQGSFLEIARREKVRTGGKVLIVTPATPNRSEMRADGADVPSGDGDRRPEGLRLARREDPAGSHARTALDDALEAQIAADSVHLLIEQALKAWVQKNLDRFPFVKNPATGAEERLVPEFEFRYIRDKYGDSEFWHDNTGSLWHQTEISARFRLAEVVSKDGGVRAGRFEILGFGAIPDPSAFIASLLDFISGGFWLGKRNEISRLIFAFQSGIGDLREAIANRISMRELDLAMKTPAEPVKKPEFSLLMEPSGAGLSIMVVIAGVFSQAFQLDTIQDLSRFIRLFGLDHIIAGDGKKQQLKIPVAASFKTGSAKKDYVVLDFPEHHAELQRMLGEKMEKLVRFDALIDSLKRFVPLGAPSARSELRTQTVILPIDGKFIREVTTDPAYLAATEPEGGTFQHRGYRAFLIDLYARDSKRNEQIAGFQRELLLALREWIILPTEDRDLLYDGLGRMASSRRILLWVNPEGHLSAFREDVASPFRPEHNAGFVVDETFRNADHFVRVSVPSDRRIAQLQQDRVGVQINTGDIRFFIPRRSELRSMPDALSTVRSGEAKLRSELRYTNLPKVDYPSTHLRIATAQINPRVGDLVGNYQKSLDYLKKAKDQDADIVVFPEMTIPGYLPEDLVHKQHFVRQNKELLKLFAKQVQGITAIIGFLDSDDEGNLYNAAAVIADGEIKGVYHKWDLPNYGVFDEKRTMKGKETALFTPGHKPFIFTVRGIPIGVNICEDIWNDRGDGLNVYDEEAKLGAKVQINLSASPNHEHKLDTVRLPLLIERSWQTGAIFVYANTVGGQDEVVFDGGDIVMAPDGTILARGKQFEEQLILVDIDTQMASNKASFVPSPEYPEVAPAAEVKKVRIEAHVPAQPMEPEEEMFEAVGLALEDYMRKNNFKTVIYGNSGGIDSAVVGAIAKLRLGADNVRAVSMSTIFNADTESDAARSARLLGVHFDEIPIQGLLSYFLTTLGRTEPGKGFWYNLKQIFFAYVRWLFLMPYFGHYLQKFSLAGLIHVFGIPEENLQARIRGMILMFESNRTGALLLTTGNKSETAVGYATLYGDMAGGFAPIKDLYKTDVYALARYINRRVGYELIPQSIIDRAPTAGLNHDQKDEDSLPPYVTELDPMLKLYLEKNAPLDALAVVKGMRRALEEFKMYKPEIHAAFAEDVFTTGDLAGALMRLRGHYSSEIPDAIFAGLTAAAEGYGREKARDVVRRIDLNEYKRRQAPPGPKRTRTAFGKDRRMPISNGYREADVEAFLAAASRSDIRQEEPMPAVRETDVSRRSDLRSASGTTGLFFGKFAPFHLGHELVIGQALKQVDQLIVLVYDHPELTNITADQMAEAIRKIFNADPRLIVIPVYGSPTAGDTLEIRQAHLDFIKSKLPEGISISKVFNNEWYGKHIAEGLGAELTEVDPGRTIYPIRASQIRRDPKSPLSVSYLHPEVRSLLEAPGVRLSEKADRDHLFKDTIDSEFVSRKPDDAEIEKTRRKIRMNNSTYADEAKLFGRVKWDPKKFAQVNEPSIAGKLKKTAEFSRPRGLRVLDMMIRDPKKGWAIPKALAGFEEAIRMAVDHERAINPDFDESYYVYITIDQKRVEPEKYQRRPGAHGDSFPTSETNELSPELLLDHTYIVSDRPEIGTWVIPGPFPMNGIDMNDDAAVLRYFDEVGQRQIAEGKARQLPAYQMIRMTPYDIHAVAQNKTGNPIERTFIKIQVSRDRLNMMGNTINRAEGPDGAPIFDYSDWTWVPRDPKRRNNRNSILGWNRADAEQFTVVDPSRIDFTAKRADFPWADPEIFYAKKIEGVHAEPARENEILENKHGDGPMSFNISQKGDWKITTSRGDQYFLSDEKFQERYFVEQGSEGFYMPRPNPVKMIRVNKPVRLRAPWGAWQYLAPGSVIAYLSEGDIYGIHAENFQASYAVTDARGHALSDKLLKPDFVLNPYVYGEKTSLEERLTSSNPGQPRSRIFGIQKWDLTEYDHPHVPVIIGDVFNRDAFSRFEGNTGVRYLDLLIHAPGQGWAIPKELAPFADVIKESVEAERLTGRDLSNTFVHITVDQKIVAPSKTGRRAGLHADSGLWGLDGKQLDVLAQYRYWMKQREGKPTDHAYIATDALPTGFYAGPFRLASAPSGSKFEELIPPGQQRVQYPAYQILRLNAYDIHESIINDTGAPVRRTFFKLQFTERLLDREKNSKNPFFNYDYARAISKNRSELRLNKITQDNVNRGAGTELAFDWLLNNVSLFHARWDALSVLANPLFSTLWWNRLHLNWFLPLRWIQLRWPYGYEEDEEFRYFTWKIQRMRDREFPSGGDVGMASEVLESYLAALRFNRDSISIEKSGMLEDTVYSSGRNWEASALTPFDSRSQFIRFTVAFQREIEHIRENLLTRSSVTVNDFQGIKRLLDAEAEKVRKGLQARRPVRAGRMGSITEAAAETVFNTAEIAELLKASLGLSDEGGELKEYLEADAESPNRSELRSMPDALNAVRSGVAKLRSELRARALTESGRKNIERLNAERPEGYPVRNFENPSNYTAKKVLEASQSKENPYGWGHPDLENPSLTAAAKTRILEAIRAQIMRFARHTKFDPATKLPVNDEETGMNGRGLLGRYGPNPAEDAVVLRYNKDGEIEVLVIDRKDNGGVALPGGMIKFGEENKAGLTASRELEEETGAQIDMSRGVVVYEGKAGDWRDTNQSWVVTRGMAVLISYEESKYVRLQAGSDAKKGSARWVKVSEDLKFYARHKIIIDAAVQKVKGGQLITTEQVVSKKLPKVDITLSSLDRAYQLFLEGRQHHSPLAYDITVPVAPHQGGFVVFAGLEETLSSIRRRRFTEEHIQYLRSLEKYSEDFLKYLREFIFEGDIDALEEGSVVSPNIPLMRIKANPLEMELLRDLVQNRIGFSTNIATKTARIVMAAGGEFVAEDVLQKLKKEFNLSPEQVKKARVVLDFGQRRGQADGSTVASLAAIIGGATATSNNRAAKQFFLEPSGTMAHLFISFFPPDQEIEAFRIWAKYYPKTSVFLLDTYDTIEAAKKAIIVAKEMEARGDRLFGVRLDSGNLVRLSQEVRRLFDEAGLDYVKIVASDDLDEFKITELISNGARIDGFGVGTNLITGGKQASLALQISENKNEERFWRARHRGKFTRYIKTSKDRVAHARYEEEINELLKPFWRGGKRTYDAKKPWKAHERALYELAQFKPENKRLKDAAPLPVDEQSAPLTINPETDGVLVIDAQKAFMLRGGLPVREGDDIMPLVRLLLERFDKKHRFASVDKHPKGHISWASSFVGIPAFTYLTYDMVKDWTESDHKIAAHALFSLEELKTTLQRIGGQMLWPDHAGENTFESVIHPGLLEKEFEFIITKGMDGKVDSYSAFFDNEGRPTGLAEELRRRGIKRLFIVGLAYDYCVGWSGEGGHKEGFEIVIVKDGTRPVGFPPDSISKMEKSFEEKKIPVVTTQEVLDANDHRGVNLAKRLEKPIAHPDFPEEEESTAFDEDMYHITMGQVFFKENLHEQKVTFDYFYRLPPYGEKHITVSGLKFFLEKLRNFRFSEEQIQYLANIQTFSSMAPFDPDYIEFLRNFRFTGDVLGLPEGSAAYGNEPILRIHGTIFEVMLIETLILKTFNFNSLESTWANHIRREHGPDVRIAEDGLIGAHGVAHQQASYSVAVGGINSTTNLDAAIAYSIPLAHAQDEGIRLEADLVTGGPKSSLGGVFKLVAVGDRPIIKLSESPVKIPYPGQKEVVVVVDSTGKVLRRVMKLQGEDLELPGDQREIRQFVVLVQGGEVIYTVPDIFEVQAYRADQDRIYTGIDHLEISPKLQALRDSMIAAIQMAQESQAGVPAPSSPRSEIRLGVRESNLPADQVKVLAQFGREMMDAARKKLDEFLIKGFQTSRKPDGSFVTEVDIAVQELWLEMIQQRFPGHYLLAEEKLTGDAASKNAELSNAAYKWIADSIDGTKLFDEGSNYFAMSLSLYHEGRPVFAIVYSPSFGVLETAQDTEHVYLNQMPIRHDGSGTIRKNLNAVIAGRAAYPEQVRKLAVQKSMEPSRGIKGISFQTNNRSIVVSLANVLRGHFDFIISNYEKKMNPWDIGAAGYLLQKAGIPVMTRTPAGWKSLTEQLYENLQAFDPGNLPSYDLISAGSDEALRFAYELTEEAGNPTANLLKAVESPDVPSEPSMELPRGLEVISERELPLDKPYAAIFDLHGILVETTWKNDYATALSQLTGKPISEMRVWVEANAHQDLDELAPSHYRIEDSLFAQTLDKVREQNRKTYFPRRFEGAYQFVKSLIQMGVPVFVVTGSPSDVARAQLDKAGFLDLIPWENIITRDHILISTGDVKGSVKNPAIESLRHQYPGHTFLHFSDSTGGYKGIRNIGGFNFGRPVGRGQEYQNNRFEQLGSEVDFMIDGFEHWQELLRFINVNTALQFQDTKVKTADFEAVEVPYILPSPRRGGLTLHIAVSDDLKTVTYSEVVDDVHVYGRDGSVDYSKLQLRKIADFPSSYLISPVKQIEALSTAEVLAAVARVWPQHKRYTSFRGVTTSWDREFDIDVWSFNIDSGYMLNTLQALKDSGELDAMNIRKAAEIGVGGGQVLAGFIPLVPGIEELSGSDISVYALRASKANVLPLLPQGVRFRTFLGKGITNFPIDLDLLLADPPYITSAPDDKRPESDPYRGTGLIRELIANGFKHLNPNNPKAAVIMNVSSLAGQDFERYRVQFQDSVEIVPLAEPLRVPLKIRTISESWKQWLVQKGYLEKVPNPKPGEEEYWHRLQTYLIRPKASVPAVRSELRLASGDGYRESSPVSTRGLLQAGRQERRLAPVLPTGYSSEKITLMVNRQAFDSLTSEERIEFYKLLEAHTESKHLKFIFEGESVSGSSAELEDFARQYPGMIEIRRGSEASFVLRGLVISISKDAAESEEWQAREQLLRRSANRYLKVLYSSGHSTPGLLTAALLSIQSDRYLAYRDQVFSEIPPDMSAQIETFLQSIIYIGKSA